jgi:hypothetical protein
MASPVPGTTQRTSWSVDSEIVFLDFIFGSAEAQFRSSAAVLYASLRRSERVVDWRLSPVGHANTLDFFCSERTVYHMEEDS